MLFALPRVLLMGFAQKHKLFRGKPHYHFRGKLRHHFVFLIKLNKIAILFKKSAVRKASRRKKRPCKEYPCKVFLLFALPRVLLMGFAQKHKLSYALLALTAACAAASRAIGTRKGEQDT